MHDIIEDVQQLSLILKSRPQLGQGLKQWLKDNVKNDDSGAVE